MSYFKKCLDVCAASRSDGITCTFVETGIDLIDMVFKLDAMVFEPLNAFRCFFCELVNQDRIAGVRRRPLMSAERAVRGSL